MDKDRDGAGGLYVRMGIDKAKKKRRCGRNEGGREVGGDERRS